MKALMPAAVKRKRGLSKPIPAHARQKTDKSVLIGRVASHQNRLLSFIAAHRSPSQLSRLQRKFANQNNNYRPLQPMINYGGGIRPCGVASAPPFTQKPTVIGWFFFARFPQCWRGFGV